MLNDNGGADAGANDGADAGADAGAGSDADSDDSNDSQDVVDNSSEGTGEFGDVLFIAAFKP